ncbi:hypothetical protein AM1BK_35950 [Neobacillus kokaensis]|uniref:Uncharacterized protein n=1 Tax=Neobacillus kokaensis TaxID=2759023 RepID=A0ABQ3N5Q5_9BACI|nr:hypothetical protein AM1BK_35950 [Neobacillus kokaensis]
MKKDILEYIKVASLLVIAISLSIIAWKTASQASELQGIQERLIIMTDRINNY